jgi:hypothetical protein
LLLVATTFALIACPDNRAVGPVLQPGDSSAIRDSAKRDSVARDSAHRDSLRRDSIARDTAGAVTLRALPVVTGLANPVYLTAPAGDPRLFVVELPGRIRIVKNGQLVATPFLDITDQVSTGSERGFLSIAFHPSYATNGFFYTYYTDLSGDIQIERYHVDTDPDRADATSRKTILSISHSTYDNHNGGLLRFGPDGMLYLGVGDGGGSGDPFGSGQSRGTLLGKVLRIDVDHGDPYAIPSDNPFQGERGEIWAYGLRNPWRYAFDWTAGLLYIADVGQNTYEEVDVAPASQGGLNYGWSKMEGLHCFVSSCDQSGLVLPVIEYTHADGCSITGGAVYRGSAIPQIAGRFFYSDYCSGWLKSFRYVGGIATEQKTWDVGSLGMVISFGEDATGELYVLSANGTVYRVTKQ